MLRSKSSKYRKYSRIFCLVTVHPCGKCSIFPVFKHPYARAGFCDEKEKERSARPLRPMRDAFLFEGIGARVRSLSGSAKDRRKHMDGVFLPGARCTGPATARRISQSICSALPAAYSSRPQAAPASASRKNTGSAHTRHPGVRAKTHAAPDERRTDRPARPVRRSRAGYTRRGSPVPCSMPPCTSRVFDRMILLQFAVKVNTTNCGYLYCTLDKKKGRGGTCTSVSAPCGRTGTSRKSSSARRCTARSRYTAIMNWASGTFNRHSIALVDFYDTSTDDILGRTDEK